MLNRNTHAGRNGLRVIPSRPTRRTAWRAVDPGEPTDPRLP